MSSRLARLRRVSQLLFFLAFLGLFAWAAYGRGVGVPVDLFLRADPLIALSTLVSLRQLLVPVLLFALPVVLLSVALGRVFCGWVCPMGTALDLSERVLRVRGRRPKQAPAWRQIKFYLLAALVVTMLLPMGHHRPDEHGLRSSVGLSATYLFDPIAMLTRTVTWSFFPSVQWGASESSRTLMAYYYSDYVGNHPLWERVLAPFQSGNLWVARTAYFRLGLLVFLMFAGMVGLGTVANRFWCRNLCPLGALLGLLGRVSPLRLRVSEACNRCLRCVNTCKMGAITEDPHVYHGPECIGCYGCVGVCPKQAISVGVGSAGASRDDAIRLDRRRLLGAAGVGLAAVVLPKVDWSAKESSGGEHGMKVSGTSLLRPPGARAEAPFVAACVRCGECMAVCPTNALQPALGEGGIEALGTPIIVPRIGACTQQCTACGSVCPAKAIEPFTVAEKSYLYLGTAQVDRNTCIAWAQGKQCVICQEGCSYHAITQSIENATQRPVVNPELCVGCGQCEVDCPVKPKAAIVVTGNGDRRHLTREEQRTRWEAAQAAAPASGAPASQSPYPEVNG